jgi:nitrite reductase/ring-hydroxylating ferredoxin subunit
MTQLDTGNGTESTATFKMLVLREGNTVRAFANRCAHFGVPLAAQPSQLIQVPLRSITCNVHYAKYRWEDGSCESGECDGESLVPVPLAVDTQGQVFIARIPAPV